MSTTPAPQDDRAPIFRVMALHALVYCERLFYLEEVEEIRVADEAVWAGRALHEELEEPAEVVDLTLESAALGLKGRVDALRHRDGTVFPVEHKRGRSRRMGKDPPQAWPSDRVQAVAYAMLLEEHLGRPVAEARIRYHRDNVTVRVPVEERTRREVLDTIQRARVVTALPQRPPVTEDERVCVRCSLAPVCLPEESRAAQEGPDHDPSLTPLRLFPPDTDRRSLHIVRHGARVGRSGENLVVSEGFDEVQRIGVREVGDVCLHGFAQVTAQALRLCADEGIPVHLLTSSGSHIGMFAGHHGGVQRRLRQYAGLSKEELVVSLARKLLAAKVEMQLRHVLRASREEETVRARLVDPISVMRRSLSGVHRATDRAGMMGHEGAAARAYWSALGELVLPDAGEELRPKGRTHRPPKDRFNALLSFGYGLLYRDILSALIRVGLEPALGVLHQPRSAAWPLALDLMELFRVPVVDMAVLGAVNRKTFDVKADFQIAGPRVWLSDEGRKKFIAVYERRKHEEYRHTVLGYSLSYARMMELEARLMEKEWSGEPNVFARFRIR
ncbi:MAG: type I-MYXAN CRISPR-associated endonuclease Cas1 [Deltaproteobacteria bacterium]|nr:type I-MYXAN CRISPR-associated endonuclease Cas1 [Deltaproteobacteria bacterium]